MKRGSFLSAVAILANLIVAPRCHAHRGGTLPATAPTHLRPGDQLWVVSCRGVAYQTPGEDLTRLRYAVYQTTSGWSPTTPDAFYEAASQSVTCVLVLGNGYTSSETQSMGQMAYRRLVTSLPPELAVRFVVWSWPSDHLDTGPIKDLRIKAGRTWQVANWLTRWVDEVQPQGPVSLLGTSFGARIVMESLELRADRQAQDVHDDDTVSLPRPEFNVALISAAVDNDWLLPGRRLDMALSQVDRMLLINNSSDRVLKRYHRLYGRRSKATALGNAGLPAVARLGPVVERITQYDAAPIIGRQHGCSAYFDSPRLVTLMQDALFSIEAPAAPLESPGLEPPSSEGASIPLASGNGN